MQKICSLVNLAMNYQTNNKQLKLSKKNLEEGVEKKKKVYSNKYRNTEYRIDKRYW